MKTIKSKLENLVERQEADIERLESELEEARNFREREWDWCHHRVIKGKQTLPVPRMEIVAEQIQEWHQFVWRYSLIYKHTLGHIVAVPMGETRVSGGSNKAPIFGDVISTPFREGVHICNDAKQLNLPAFALCDGRTWKVCMKDGKCHQEEITAAQ